MDETNQEPAPDSFDLTLEEFCVRLSMKDRRPEMIGGFQHSERAAGHTKDSEGNFTSRYLTFVQQPA